MSEIAALRVEVERLRLELDAAERKLSCGYDTGEGQNCGECRDCLTVNWYFARDALAAVRAGGNAADALRTLFAELDDYSIRLTDERLDDLHSAIISAAREALAVLDTVEAGQAAAEETA